jgi:hypothetical protein
MPLFEIAFTTHDGEREYTQKEYVAAKDIDQASGYATESLKTFWGDEPDEDGDLPTTVDEDGWAWGCGGEVATEVEWVSSAQGFSVINLETNEVEYYKLVKITEKEYEDDIFSTHTVKYT